MSATFQLVETRTEMCLSDCKIPKIIPGVGLIFSTSLSGCILTYGVVVGGGGGGGGGVVFRRNLRFKGQMTRRIPGYHIVKLSKHNDISSKQANIR